MKSLMCLVLLFSFSARSPAAPVSPSPYGINVHLARNNVLNLVRDAGIKWIRIDINWINIEPLPGQRDFSQVDRVVNYAVQNGLSVLATIAYTPGWANGNKGMNHPADHTPHWQNFVSQVVNRYKDRVKYWSIWNEPNTKRFFTLPKDAFVQRVFRPAGAAIRSADPSAFIVGPDLAHLTSEDQEWFFWLKYILEQGSDFIDIISHHIYENRGVYYVFELLERGEGFLPAIIKVIDDAGQGHKPLWLTEIGWHTSQFSPQVQAERYLEMLQTMKSRNLPAKIFFYEIIDDTQPGVPPYGIIRSNLEKKPAYYTYQQFIVGGFPDGNGIEPPNSRKCYAEEMSAGTDDGPVIVATLRDLRTELACSGNKGIELIDFYYQINEAFAAASRSDSRIFRLGQELMREISITAHPDPGFILDKPLSREQLAKVDRLLALLAESEAFSAWSVITAAARHLLPSINGMTARQLMARDLPGKVLKGRGQAAEN